MAKPLSIRTTLVAGRGNSSWSHQMHRRAFLPGVVALSLAACRPPNENQLVGNWLSRCSIDICTVTTLRADHTFCDQFDDKNITEPSVCGTWRLEGGHLVMDVTWTAPAVPPGTLGRQLKYQISDFRRDSFAATLNQDKRRTFRWKRHH